MARTYSWGNIPRVDQKVVAFNWADQSLPSDGDSLLPWGLGRSYGDSCVNDGNSVLSMRCLDRLIAFDTEQGLLRCEAGVSLADILELVVPHGWFLPVSPGTKYVTVGGAIANDVHGKNHHLAGSFGCWVESIDLLRSDDGVIRCSLEQNPDVFSATIGGLGLTGLILTATIKLKRIPGPWIDSEVIKFRGLSEFRSLSESSAASYEYVVAWFDCMGSRADRVRGLFSRGNHVEGGTLSGTRKRSITIPLMMPRLLMNPTFVRIFNALYYAKQLAPRVTKRVHYDPFLYPLDSIRQWNRVYGRAGFYQYQCVVPVSKYDIVEELVERMGRAGIGSFLAVLKEFGSLPSRGLLSFPRPGITIALDFPNRGDRTKRLMEDLDKLVMAVHGAVYPAKDARMSVEVFRESFPRWEEFLSYVDPRFSSSFWRRVNEE